ncbi:energy transducer TonB [Microbulbifer sp. PSTR4-B]|uniref:energy transducer TonB n=1 Tax=Microbulbifer sp. PSTR4-B TaxID=3243396 RepID=UPI004039ED69
MMRIIFFAIPLFFSMLAFSKENVIKVDPPTGSHIKRVAVSGRIPFDRPYSELSEKEKRIFTSEYENFQEGDEPPFPKEGLKALHWPLYKGHEISMKRGILDVIALINEDGDLEKISIYESPNKYMSDLAIAVFRETKFKPAICSGMPCTMEFPLKINFKVK